MSGGSRLVTGLAKLLFLALGMLVATSLVRLPPDRLLPPSPDATFGWLATCLGVILFAIGHALHFFMPLRQLPWLHAVLGVAEATAVMSGIVFGGSGGFFGALAMTTVAYFVQYRLGGPPAVVMFPPGR